MLLKEITGLLYGVAIAGPLGFGIGFAVAFLFFR